MALIPLPSHAQTESDWALQKIAAPAAWNITQGSNEIIVAVIDTGLDLKNKTLTDALWTNGKEIPNNNLDDDKNGFIDDIHGWDFTLNTNQFTDHHGHGTHIAGLVHKTAPKVKLMILKYYDPTSPPAKNLENTLAALKYAVQMRPHIINYSGGGETPSRHEESLLRQAQALGILVVAAAGNEFKNSDQTGFYPAAYDLDNIISVTAVNAKEEKVKSSNFGKQTVDIAAPGHQIQSYMQNGEQGKMTGTSQATAFVSGVAALIMSSLKDPREIGLVKRQLASSNHPSEKLRTYTRWGFVVNSYRALAQKETGTSAFQDRPQNLPEDLEKTLENL